VRQGETLASIAQRYYGEVSREATLVAANVLSAQINASIVPGIRIVVPSVSYYRVAVGDSWTHIAQRELGSASRATYLAQVNNGNMLAPGPAPGTVLRVPYLLRYVVLDEEPLFEIARRFYGDRSQVQFILEFNHLSSTRLQRGQLLLLPLPDLTLREEPHCEDSAQLADTNRAQREVDQQLPTLAALVLRGQYVETIALGSRLSATPNLSTAQRAAIYRAVAEAYCAVDRSDLGAEAFREVLAAEHGYTLDPRTSSPKLLEAFNAARGMGRTRTIAPAPPTARPEGAH
jgi:LysM repeat protein